MILYGTIAAHARPHRYVPTCIWALKKINLDWGATLNQGMSDLNVLDEFLLKAYEVQPCTSRR